MDHRVIQRPSIVPHYLHDRLSSLALIGSVAWLAPTDFAYVGSRVRCGAHPGPECPAVEISFARAGAYNSRPDTDNLRMLTWRAAN